MAKIQKPVTKMGITPSVISTTITFKAANVLDTITLSEEARTSIVEYLAFYSYQLLKQIHVVTPEYLGLFHDTCNILEDRNILSAYEAQILLSVITDMNTLFPDTTITIIRQDIICSMLMVHSYLHKPVPVSNAQAAERRIMREEEEQIFGDDIE